MPDPFSISLGVVALLQQTYSAGNSLREFIHDAGIIDATLRNLQDEINGLARVLESMRITFEKVEVEEGTGHVAAHWRNVAQSIQDGKGILQQLEDQITNIGQTSKFLDGARKQHRLNSQKNRIAAFRLHVQSYRDGLQLSLQTITLWNQVSHQDAASQVLPTLNDLQSDIRRIALDMNQKIETLQALVVSKQDQEQVNAMQHLHDCMRSAASIVSSASTKMPTTVKDDSETVMRFSDFGDCFSVEQTFAMRRWMQAQTVTAYDDAEPQAIPESVACIGDHGEISEGSDSEADIENELISALLEKGKQSMADGDVHAAQRPFRNCLSRLSTLQATKRSTRYTSRYLDVMDRLLQIYWQQKDWPEAQNILRQRMAIRERLVGNEDADYMEDVLMLAVVTHYEGKLAESHLYARRALRGYRRLQNGEKAKACLKLLIDQSKADGNEDDTEAYLLLLEVAETQHAPKVSNLLLDPAIEEIPQSVVTPRGMVVNNTSPAQPSTSASSGGDSTAGISQDQIKGPAAVIKTSFEQNKATAAAQAGQKARSPTPPPPSAKLKADSSPRTTRGSRKEVLLPPPPSTPPVTGHFMNMVSTVEQQQQAVQPHGEAPLETDKEPVKPEEASFVHDIEELPSIDAAGDLDRSTPNAERGNDALQNAVEKVAGSSNCLNDTSPVSQGQSEELGSFKDYYSTDEIHRGGLVATLWSYEPRARDEFHLERGDMFKVISMWDDGWATGVRVRQRAEDWRLADTVLPDSELSRDTSNPLNIADEGEVWAFPCMCLFATALA